ncbi:MAG: nicotinamide-nucleotide amidohydrolase family protein [Pseudomonadota bacterium]
MTDQDLDALAEQVAAALLERGWMLATAESCTGGWVAKVCTDLAGSSRWFERGFVTYTNEAKQEMLGVEPGVLAEQGAVSEATVRQMAAGALARSRARLALAISGIAGPGGATPFKPVGMVCLAWTVSGDAVVSCTRHFEGDRDAVRRQAVAAALQGVLDVLATA